MGNNNSTFSLEKSESAWQKEFANQSINILKAKETVENYGIPFTKRMQIWTLFLKQEINKANDNVFSEDVVNKYKEMKESIIVNEESRLFQCLLKDRPRLRQLPFLQTKESQDIILRVLYYSYTKNNLDYMGGQHYLLIPFLVAAVSQFEGASPNVIDSEKYVCSFSKLEVIEAFVFSLFDAFIQQNFSQFNFQEVLTNCQDQLAEICHQKDQQIYQWILRIKEFEQIVFQPFIMFHSITSFEQQLKIFDYLIANQNDPQFINKFRMHLTIQSLIHYKKTIFQDSNENENQDQDYQVIERLKQELSLLESTPKGIKTLNELITKSYQSCVEYIH